MDIISSNENKNNSHLIKIDNKDYKIFNQLNDTKNVSNFYVPKKKIREFTNNSFKVQIYNKFISIPKKFCHLDKTKKYYLVGMNVFFSYWIYDIEHNMKFKLVGHKTIESTNIKAIHNSAVNNRRFEKEQEKNPFLKGFNSFSEARNAILLQTEKEKELYRQQTKDFVIAHKRKKHKQHNTINSVYDNYIKEYEKNQDKIKNKGSPEIDIEQLIHDLNNLE